MIKNIEKRDDMFNVGVIESSYSLLGSDDGQQALEEFIRDCL